MRSVLQNGAIGLALIGAGILAGGIISPMEPARAEVRTSAPSQALQSGGQLSLPILKEIAATLHQMESRLARLEAVAQKLQVARPDRVGNN